MKSVKELPEGIGKVAYYVGILNTIDMSASAGAWHPGNTFTANPDLFPVDSAGLRIAVVGPPMSGVLPYVIYQLNNPNELAKVPLAADIPELNTLPRQTTAQAYNTEVRIGVAVATTATYYLARAVATAFTAQMRQAWMTASLTTAEGF